MPVAAKEGTEQIPDKLYFRIGEVSRLLGVKPYVLRYWESEFGSLAPKKSGTGQRLYRRKDVERALEIKRLLYEKRYTIEGARNFLAARNEKQPAPPVPKQGQLFAMPALVEEIRRELNAILELLR